MMDFYFSATLLLFTCIVVLAYALRLMFIGRAQFARVDRQGGSALLGKGPMEMVYWALQPVGDACIALGVTANAVSWLSLGFGVATAVALGYGHFGVAGVLTLVSSLLDAVDGLVARKSGAASDSGEVLDASVDRYVEFLFFAGLAVFYREMVWIQMLTLAALLGSFMVSYSTAKAEALHVEPPRGAMRRTERGFYLTLGAVMTPVIDPWTVPNFDFVGMPMVLVLLLIAIAANYSAIVRLRAVALAVNKKLP